MTMLLWALPKIRFVNYTEFGSGYSLKSSAQWVLRAIASIPSAKKQKGWDLRFF